MTADSAVPVWLTRGQLQLLIESHAVLQPIWRAALDQEPPDPLMEDYLKAKFNGPQFWLDDLSERIARRWLAEHDQEPPKDWEPPEMREKIARRWLAEHGERVSYADGEMVRGSRKDFMSPRDGYELELWWVPDATRKEGKE